MYLWRKMSEKQREDALEYRRLHRFPRHSPPHFDSERELQYLVSGTCYEHAHVIGKSAERMSECEQKILAVFEQFSIEIYAWCILPNHYHILTKTAQIKEIRNEIGLFNGKTSYKWNGEDEMRSRKVWHNCFERKMKSERHFYATLNYVLHNPVHHGYATRWQDWLWSNANEYLEKVGRQKALEIWKRYPILNYGEKWDTK